VPTLSQCSLPLCSGQILTQTFGSHCPPRLHLAAELRHLCSIIGGHQFPGRAAPSRSAQNIAVEDAGADRGRVQGQGGAPQD
jgi:hypothetical protein